MDIHNLREMTTVLVGCCLTEDRRAWLSDNVAGIIAWTGQWHIEDPAEPDETEDWSGSMILVRLGTGDRFGLLLQNPGPEGHGRKGCTSVTFEADRLPELLNRLTDDDIVQLFADGGGEHL